MLNLIKICCKKIVTDLKIDWLERPIKVIKNKCWNKKGYFHLIIPFIWRLSLKATDINELLRIIFAGTLEWLVPWEIQVIAPRDRVTYSITDCFKRHIAWERSLLFLIYVYLLLNTHKFVMCAIVLIKINNECKIPNYTLSLIQKT